MSFGSGPSSKLAKSYSPAGAKAISESFSKPDKTFKKSKLLASMSNSNSVESNHIKLSKVKINNSEYLDHMKIEESGKTVS